MKNISELLNIDTEQQVIDGASTVTEVSSSVEIPDYMKSDPAFVGYPDLQMQESIYQMACHGIINLDVNSILDVGCGRGDFGDYIVKSIKSDIYYTGIDSNEIMVNVGRDKYAANLSETFKLEHGTFNDSFTQEGKFDWVFHNTNLSINYGMYDDESQKYDYIKSLILKSLELSTIGITMILLNSDEVNDQYIQYDIGIMSKMLLEMNVRFGIDNTNFQNIYKLIIFNETF